MKKNYLIKRLLLCLSIYLMSNFSGFSQTYPPSCVITMPHSNAYFKEKTDIEIHVYSSDIGKSQNNGTVTKVEFYNGTTLLGEATTQSNYTYKFIWQCVPAGTYTLKAKATNSSGVTFTSVGVIITVGTTNVTQRGMSACKGKYLANIIPGGAQINYNTYWNGVTAENACKWGPVEGSRDNMSWSGANTCYNHAKSNNMMFRYHAAVWASQYPSWLTSLSTADARAEAVEYMQAIAQNFPLADQIDVLNEQLGTHQSDNQKFRDLFSGKSNCSQTDYSWQVWLFEQARAIFPNTKLILNDYGLENDQNAINTQLGLIKALRDRGLIDGFGSQAHCFNIDGLSASSLKSSLDLMAKGGVPIYITELDLNGGSENNSNDAAQLSSYKTHFPVYWEHPAVAGITLWGYVTGSTWIGGTGLVSSSGTEKSAMTWLKQYVSGLTDVGYPFCSIPTSNACNNCSTAAPSVPSSTIKYKVGATASALTATGTSLKWYTVASGGTALTSAPIPSTTTAGTTTYYVSQTANGCESNRTAIVVTVYKPQEAYGGTPWPIPGTIQFENYDTGGQDSAYSDNSAGTQVSPAPDFRTTEDVDIETCTDTDGGYNIGYAMAGEWMEYTVNVAATGTYTLTLRVACNGDGRTLSVSTNGTTLANNVAVSNTGGWQTWANLTINNISLTAGVQVIRITIGSTDYVNLNYMTFASNASLPPTVTSPVLYCQGATASALSATGTSLKWYTAATGGTALASTPVPSTTATGNTDYYVSQTTGGVESSRAKITVTVSASPSAPTVTTPVTYAVGATASPLTATGTSLKWYNAATGGTASTTAPTPVTSAAATTSYYVSQTVNSCESPRARIDVVVGSSMKISLITGWNLIGCPISGSTDISKALSSIWSQVITVKNLDSFWDINNNSALNSLTKLNWGQGYYVKVKAPCELDWIVR